MQMNEIQDQIINTFSILPGRFEQYNYLVDCACKLEPLDEVYKTESYALSGCESQVWIYEENKQGRILFKADSDSILIRGILFLLLKVLNGQSKENIINADLYFLKQTGLSVNLSPARKLGIDTIVKEMKSRISD